MEDNRLANGQVRQNLDLPPSEGEGGFVGNEPSAPLGVTVVSGKRGFVNSSPVWSEQSSGDGGGDPVPDFNKASMDSTDEDASYKWPVTDSGLPQTYRTREDYDGAPTRDVPGNITGKSTVQKVPDATDGEHEMSILPQTSVTHEGGSGIPMFRNGNKTNH